MDETTPPEPRPRATGPEPEPQAPGAAGAVPPLGADSALRAIRDVAAGADPAAEAFALSNDYTDRHLERLRAWWGRRRGRGDSDVS
ncbi:hypothetical protein GRS96_18685 [Rathayibacter sp. VKM Ac-2803]|uniref:hypothetical protein n=1 Tax=Rathayibacter sp. VKM Ac-2803 TaxID=2609256 RepID=UPI001357810E|nr:hypothetical protein [Rathayibacter sp. VKM Ac-2803]MWV51302.1 hypothetical protein [Rathayibacter sp. VKM Ac-2803]